METREMNYMSSTLDESVYDTFVPFSVLYSAFVEARFDCHTCKDQDCVFA